MSTILGRKSAATGEDSVVVKAATSRYSNYARNGRRRAEVTRRIQHGQLAWHLAIEGNCSDTHEYEANIVQTKNNASAFGKSRFFCFCQAIPNMRETIELLQYVDLEDKDVGPGNTKALLVFS